VVLTPFLPIDSDEEMGLEQAILCCISTENYLQQFRKQLPSLFTLVLKVIFNEVIFFSNIIFPFLKVEYD